jgi:hypothetical protein
MKFSRTTLFTAALAAASSQLGSALEEETIGGINVVKYPVSEVITRMPKPLTPDGVPAHLQYIVGLDQDGAVVPGTGVPLADPEYAISLSSGTFDGKKQTLNRCYGGEWTFYDVATKKLIKEEGEGLRTLTATGRDFLTQISGSDSDCSLYFNWNEDFSEAVITGYWEPAVAENQVKLFNAALDLKIELEPYWRWKFSGVDMEPGIFNRLNRWQLKKLDEKCCPPKDNNQCQGENKLGVEGPCETISTACGEIDEDDLSACIMYKRRNVNPLGFEIPIMSNYPIYPLADRYGNPTPYNKFYEDAVSARGIETIFHGLERAGNEL